jgi:hypothetical protein
MGTLAFKRILWKEFPQNKKDACALTEGSFRERGYPRGKRIFTYKIII